MRYIIYGAGAVGSLLGGYLAQAGSPVILIGRPAQVAAIEAGGLVIKNKFGVQTIPVAAVESLDAVRPGADDVLFLSVKSQDTAASVASLRAHFAPTAPLFCWQNGVRNEPLAAESFDHVYGGLVFMSVRYVEPGHVVHTTGKTLVLGRYPEGIAAPDWVAAAVAGDLEAAGFRALVFEQIMALKWSKLVLNTSNALYALTGMPIIEACNLPEVQHFVADVWDEGLDVLDAAGIDYRPVPGQPELRAMTARLRQTVPPRDAPDDPDLSFYPSTWQDLDLGRTETELPYLNGEIIALGQQHHVPTPLNALLERLVEEMAAKGERPGKYTIDDLRAMRAGIITPS
jgi:2-dehydropantoate 2-reductase